MVTPAPDDRVAAARTAVVTGGAQGIGAAIAAMLTARGHRVAVADLAFPSFERIGSASLHGPCDVRDPASIRTFVEQTERVLGPVGILVNNAGVYPMQPFATITAEDWRNVMATNVDSVFHFCQATLPAMRRNRWGRIINIASNTFFMGLPNLAHYIASKGAMIGMSRSLAAEVGREGITVNCVAPNFTRTEGTARVEAEAKGVVATIVATQSIGRVALPDDIVGTVGFLASNDAAFLTGQTIVVDGGLIKN